MKKSVYWLLAIVITLVLSVYQRTAHDGTDASQTGDRRTEWGELPTEIASEWGAAG